MTPPGNDAGAAAARTPLIAGNWKMHNNHLEALALVQKLAFTLSAKDFKAVEVAVLPPFTDGYYDDEEFGVRPRTPPEAILGDCWHRFYMRMLEVVESIKICQQALERYKTAQGSHRIEPPRHLPPWLGRLLAGEAVVSMMTRVRGASNARARRELGWTPRYASWRDGFRTGLGNPPA